MPWGQFFTVILQMVLVIGVLAGMLIASMRLLWIVQERTRRGPTVIDIRSEDGDLSG